MRDQHQIDEFFKNRLSGIGSPGPINDDWVGAEKLLNAHYRKVALKRFIGVGIIVSVLGIIGALLFVNDFSNLKAGNRRLEKNFNEKQSLSNNSAVLDSVGSNYPLTLIDSTFNDFPEKDQANATHYIQHADDLSRFNKSVDYKSVTKINDTSIGSNKPADAITKTAVNLATNSPFNRAPHSPIQATSSFAQLQEGQLSVKELSAEKIDFMPAFEVGALHISLGSVTDRTAKPILPLTYEQRRVEVMLEAGGLLSNVLQNTSNSSAGGIAVGYFYGLGLKYHFHPNLFALVGANLHSRNGLNSNYNIQSSFSGTWTAEPILLTYVDIPIKVGYNKGRHSIDFGMSFSPLVSAQVIERLETTTDNGSGNMVLEERITKQREGFAGFDVAGNAGYQLQINPRLSGQIGVRFGLFDLTDNAYFSTAIVDDRNHQLRIGLSYSILQR